LARQNVITKIKDSGKKLYVWTVNSTTDIRRLADRGVDGIISDHPQRLARVFAASIEAQK
jgi:glycerophosphoryl diester phosphodiesterase